MPTEAGRYVNFDLAATAVPLDLETCQDQIYRNNSQVADGLIDDKLIYLHLGSGPYSPDAPRP